MSGYLLAASIDLPEPATLQKLNDQCVDSEGFLADKLINQDAETPFSSKRQTGESLSERSLDLVAARK